MQSSTGSTESIIKSLFLSIAGRHSALIIQLVSIMVISRLLTPAEIGVFSVGMAIVAYSHIIRDFGVSNYLVQTRDLDNAKIRAALTITMAIAWALGAVLVLAGNLVAEAYGESGLQNVLMVLALNFAFLPFGSTVMAVLRRDMRFGAIYVIAITSALSAASVSMSLAWLGNSYMSLAWGSVAGTLCTTVVALIYSPHSAHLIPTVKGLGRVFSFGMKETATRFFQESRSSGPPLVLAQTVDFTGVGLFGRAQGVAELFNQIVMQGLGPVILPALTGAHRRGEDMVQYFLTSVACVSGLCWPFFAFIALFAEPIILLLYGTQWTNAAPVAQWLCIAAIGFPVSVVAGSLLITLGAMTVRMIISGLSAVILLTGLFIGSLISLEAAAFGPIAGSLTSGILMLAAVRSRIALPLRTLILEAGQTTVVTASSMVLPVALTVWTPVGMAQSILHLSACGLAWALGWLLGVWITDHPLKQVLKAHVFPIILQQVGSLGFATPRQNKG